MRLGGRDAIVSKVGKNARALHLGKSHRDSEFMLGRQAVRQLVFDAVGMHTGAVAERSSEAHIRGAREEVLFQAWIRLRRTEGQLQSMLAFYDGGDQLRLTFADPAV